jgi:uncharacterized protein YcbX
MLEGNSIRFSVVDHAKHPDPDMNVVGTVDSLWRYPIKSMAGEALPEAFVGYAGVYGDRIFAFLNSAGARGFPYFTGRDRREMLLYRPRFRNPHVASTPPNQPEALQLAELSPVYPSLAELEVDVGTPSGLTLAVDDPALLAMLAGQRSPSNLSLLRSHRAMTDCRPVSLISLETIVQLGDEVNATLDKRRFRANIYAQLGKAKGFAEDAFVGRRLQIGSRVVVSVLEQDARCKMITINPDTAKETPAIMRNVARAHGGNAGVYCAVLTEGVAHPGDPIVLLD